MWQKVRLNTANIEPLTVTWWGQSWKDWFLMSDRAVDHLECTYTCTRAVTFLTVLVGAGVAGKGGRFSLLLPPTYCSSGQFHSTEFCGKERIDKKKLSNLRFCPTSFTVQFRKDECFPVEWECYSNEWGCMYFTTQFCLCKQQPHQKCYICLSYKMLLEVYVCPCLQGK